MALSFISQGFTVDGVAPTTGDEVYLNPDETKRIIIAVKNTSGFTWLNSGANAVKLGTANPHDRACGFSNNGTAYGWSGTNRVLMVESSVANNATAHFEFDVVGKPEASNWYQEYFTPIKEGIEWGTPDPSLYIIFDMRPIGTTVFTWYSKEGHHWSGQPANRTTDTPVLGGSIPAGKYTSMDPAVAYRQLELLKDCGFNLLLLDFAGQGTITDDGCNALIGQIRANPEFKNFRYAFFLDNITNWGQGLFDYLYSFSSDPFHARLGNKPLLTVFGAASASDSGNRFDMRTMGSNDTSRSWHWETFPGGPSQVLGIAGTVIPRYDDRKTGEMPFGRPSTQYYNANLDTTMFADQFATVKSAWNNRTIRYAFFNAWNEYSERIGPIEPHVDININGVTPGSIADNFLFTSTQSKISELKA